MRTRMVGDTPSKNRTPRPSRRPARTRRADATSRPDQALVGLLRTTPLLAGVPRDGVVRIASQMRRRRLPAGTTIVKQGEPARALYLLAAGRLEVTVAGGDAESPPVNILDAPSWFGELAVLTRQPRTSTVTALTDSEVWTLPRRAFEAALTQYPWIGRSVIRSLCDRIQHKDQDFLGQSALALERARLLADLRERNDALAALGEIARAVSASLDVDTTLRAVSAYASQLTHSDSASLFLYDAARDRAEVCASHNTPEDYLKAIESHQPAGATGATQEPTFGLSLVAKVVRERAPVQIPDAEADTHQPNRDLYLRWGYRALLGVPVLHGPRLVGALSVRRKRVGEFNPREVELVTTFARQAAVAIVNARLFGELQEKASQLEVVSRHKSQFLASMSHELRTPLNAIIGFSEVLLDPDMGPFPPEEQREFLGNILTSGRHLLRLINDILDLSKVEAGKMELHPEPVSVQEVAEGVVATLKSLAAKKQLRVESDFSADLPAAWADPPRLKQILYNLLSNAIKFTPAGGRVRVTARSVSVWKPDVTQRNQGTEERAPQLPSSPAPQQFLEVSVTDTGVGIPAEHLERIFQEFEQVVDTTLPRQEGTGLGLPLVKKFVELHGGTIRASSSPGHGSAFVFTIPTAP
jgi:signal transduction histidine kinase/CRP-like cAMP-binding protein